MPFSNDRVQAGVSPQSSHLTKAMSGSPFFDDVRGELRPVGAADVPRQVRSSGRDEQDVAGLDPRRPAADLVLQRAFKDINDLFAWMRVHRSDKSRIEVDAHLDDLASRSAEIVPLLPAMVRIVVMRPSYWRSDRNAARSSAAKSSGCSQAA